MRHPPVHHPAAPVRLPTVAEQRAMALAGLDYEQAMLDAEQADLDRKRAKIAAAQARLDARQLYLEWCFAELNTGRRVRRPGRRAASRNAPKL